MRQCKAAIGSFCGLKYSCRELGNFEAGMLEAENGRYKIAVGAVDEVLSLIFQSFPTCVACESSNVVKWEAKATERMNIMIDNDLMNTS